MESNHDEQIDIKLSKAELLVLFEFLTRSHEPGRTAASQEVANFILAKPDLAERTALWNLECVIERNIVGVFADNYDELVRAAKERLLAND